MRPAFLFAVCSAALTIACVQASEPSPAPAAKPESTIDQALETADRLLARTGDAAQAARDWLRENVSREAIEGMSDEAVLAARARFDAALEGARQRHAESLGVFIYRGQDVKQPWERPGDSLPERVVVLIHGLDEGGTIWDEAAPAIHAEGFSVLRFNYPNDQPIARSSEALAESLRALRSKGARECDLIGHSMGGLLARDALTRAERDGFPAVPRLIMLGTPNHGAPLAPLRGVMEVRDQFVRWMKSDDKTCESILGFMADGQGEAGEDLVPGSAFLNDLNARALPSGVAITIVEGKAGADTRDGIISALDSPFIRRALGEEQARALKSNALGLFDDLGDGAVPARSAALEGVKDVVRVPADHRSMIRTLEPLDLARRALGKSSPTPPAIPIILDRLRREPGALVQEEPVRSRPGY